MLLGDVDINDYPEDDWRAFEEQLYWVVTATTVSSSQGFEHIALNACIFVRIFHLTCKTKKIVLPILLTSRDSESTEKTFLFLFFFSLHFILGLVAVAMVAMRCGEVEKRENHFSFQRKTDMSPLT